MKDWKTTLSGLLMAVAMAAKTFGLDIPQEVIDSIILLAAFAIGFFAKDKK